MKIKLKKKKKEKKIENQWMDDSIMFKGSINH